MESVNNNNKNKSKKNKTKTTTSQINQHNVKEHKESRIKYKKRKGTSGATGQLYESKLLSLVLLRCLTDNEIEDFLLGSNVDGVGDLDDICLRFTYNNKPIAAFIQSKHKDDASKGITDSSLYSPKSKVNLLKCFDSYLQVLNKFDTDDSHIFNGVFKDLTFHFVIYTSAVNKISKEKIKQVDVENNYIFVKVREIISCKDHDPNSGDIFQIAYDEQDIHLLSNVLIDKKIDMIAKHFVSFIHKKGKNNYDIFRKYADILVPDVITLTENDDYYDATLNPKVFYAADEILIKLKYKIYEEILSISQVDTQYLQTNLQLLLSADNESSRRTYLSRLIYRYVEFDEKFRKLNFNAQVKENVTNEFSRQLQQLQVSKALVNEALEEAGTELLNSKYVQFKILKQEIDINVIKECNEKKLLFNNEINIAKVFMSTLYLYTNQGQEKDVGEKLISEISQYCESSENFSNKSRVQADVAFLKFHDKVQKWWLLDGKSYFLTKTCDYLKELVSEIAQPFADMLNFIYQQNTVRYNIKFVSQAMNSLERINDNKITNLITRSSLLTTLKLKQFFCGVCVFIDYNFFYNIQENEWESLRKELKNNTNSVLILVTGDKFKDSENSMALWLIRNIIDVFEGRIVIVTNEIFFKSNNCIVESNNMIIDENITMADMATETQNMLLEHEVEFQGHKVKLKDLVDTDFSVINIEIIHRILKNEAFTIGHTLSNFDYEHIKDYYLPRTFLNKIEENEVTYDEYDDDDEDVSIDDTYSEFILNTFKDMPRNINVISAEPGMGKSTILTHLSIETKKEYIQTWIIRMNLLDFCDEFEKLGPSVNETEFMKLILKSEYEDVSNFSIEDVSGNMVVKYTGNDDLIALSLKIMMNCFSKGNMIFLFDGFDEICPDYQTQATNFIKNIDYDNLLEGDRFSSACLTKLFYPSESKYFQIWITCRPYNLIIQHLEKEFGTPLILKPLTSDEQNQYFEKYWNVNLKTQEIDMAHFNNIQTFFDFMAQFAKNPRRFMEHISAIDVPLYQMYISAVRYFTTEIMFMPLNIDKKKVIKKWVSDKELQVKLVQSELTRDDQSTCKEQNVGAPLFMNMAAKYFVAEIKSGSPKSQIDWDLGYATLDYYKRFVKLKLKVRFEDKNDMNISKPDVMMIFSNEQDSFVNIHKRLAFYAMFHNSKYMKGLLTERDRQDIELTMQKIRDGKEKSGLIESIHNKIPKFIHRTFAEFFAIEFIVDIILTKPKLLDVIMDLILNFLLRQNLLGLMTIFDQKLKYDGTELRNILEQDSVKKLIFELMTNQKESGLESSLHKAIDNNLPNVTMLLLRCIDNNLTKENIESFVTELLDKSFFLGMMTMNHPELLDYALNMISKVDSVYLKTLIPDIGFYAIVYLQMQTLISGYLES